MGNHFPSKCCNASTFSQPDIEQPNNENNNFEFLLTPPKINQMALQALLKQKPFESQFSKQQTMLIVKTRDDLVYQGLIDTNKLPHGYGKIYKENGILIIGKFEHGQRIGQHYLFLPDGSFYKGIIENDSIIEGEYHGQESFKYFGQFRNYQLHGKGSQSHNDYHFQGEYQMGKRVKGLLKWQENNFVNSYNGTFDEEQLFDGVAELTTREGTYKGEFKKGLKEGNGVFEYANGLTYQGEYLNGQKNGLGKVINSNGTISYEGEFLNGLPHGKGKSLNERGKMKQGEFQYGIAAQHYNRLAQYKAIKGSLYS